MNLIPLLTFTAGIFLGLLRVFGKLASPHIHPVVAALVMQLAMLAVGGAVFLALRPEIKQPFLSRGILFAILAGISAALFDMLVYTVFRMGGNLSIFTVVVNVISIVLAVIIGTIFLKEALTPVQFVSIGVVLVGIYFLLK